MQTPIAPGVFCRWMIGADLQYVLACEDAQHLDGPAWTLDDVLRTRSQRDLLVGVADVGFQVCGWCVLARHTGRYNLVRIAVRQDFRRRGVGTSLVNWAKTDLHPWKRGKIRTLVPEGWLQLQLFLRACGFRAMRQPNGNYAQAGHYRLEYRLEEDPCCGIY